MGCSSLLCTGRMCIIIEIESFWYTLFSAAIVICRIYLMKNHRSKYCISIRKPFAIPNMHSSRSKIPIDAEPRTSQQAKKKGASARQSRRKNLYTDLEIVRRSPARDKYTSERSVTPYIYRRFGAERHHKFRAKPSSHSAGYLSLSRVTQQRRFPHIYEPGPAGIVEYTASNWPEYILFCLAQWVYVIYIYEKHESTIECEF